MWGHGQKFIVPLASESPQPSGERDVEAPFLWVPQRGTQGAVGPLEGGDAQGVERRVGPLVLTLCAWATG